MKRHHGNAQHGRNIVITVVCAAVSIVTVIQLGACGGNEITPSMSTASSSTTMMTEDGTMVTVPALPEWYTPTPHRETQPDDVAVRFPDPLTPEYQKLVDQATDPLIKQIFADGIVTSGEYAEANDRMQDIYQQCIKDHGVIDTSEGMRWDDAHKHNAFGDIEEVYINCGSTDNPVAQSLLALSDLLH